jgi:hypothetical protein
MVTRIQDCTPGQRVVYAGREYTYAGPTIPPDSKDTPLARLDAGPGRRFHVPLEMEVFAYLID